ncbi:MAG: HPr(Ser) kinase/phosphatase [Fibrobacteria bacterium]|nr:HPr(Ser) kinase/phosphatase [Fibrobacteria bacterium]
MTLKTSEESLCTEIIEIDLNRPGLALSGFTDVFSFQRIQVIGTSEWTFLEMSGVEKRQEIFRVLQDFRSPLWILTHNFPIHQELIDLCREQNIPIMTSSLSTIDLITVTQKILTDYFSPYCTLHGTLVDIYGVGVLYTGKSGVGKSECALDLVERGHRLVADDSVDLMRKGDSIIGKGNQSLGHHMEIRGVGIVEVDMLFGIRAIRDRKKVEIIVELQQWKDGVHYDRTGLDELNVDIMGIPIPHKIIPVSPGKNITVISEVIAMNMLLKMNGVNVAKLFNDKLLKIMNKKVPISDLQVLSSDVNE